MVNGDFAVADPVSPQFGWTIAGTVAVTDGRRVIRENETVNSGLAQTFTLPAGATALRFSVVRAGFVANPTGNPTDAFEAALLNPTTQLRCSGRSPGWRTPTPS